MTGTATGALIVLNAIGWLAGLVIPDREISLGIYGAKSSGKSTLHASIYNGFTQVHQTRLPTTQPGAPSRTKVILDNAPRGVFRDYRKTQWLKQDVPHDLEYIQPNIMAYMPEVIFWVIGADNWKHEFNQLVAAEIGNVMASDEYRNITKAKWRVTYKKIGGRKGMVTRHLKAGKHRCKYIVMLLNKLDLIPVETRAEVCKEVMRHYLELPAVQYLRDESGAKFTFIAASLQDAICLPARELSPVPLKDWFTEVVKTVVYT